MTGTATGTAIPKAEWAVGGILMPNGLLVTNDEITGAYRRAVDHDDPGAIFGGFEAYEIVNAVNGLLAADGGV